MKWIYDMVGKFILRTIVGIAMIVMVNQFLEKNEVDVNVGINPVTAITSGTLGVPGVCLLYGIMFF